MTEDGFKCPGRVPVFDIPRVFTAGSETVAGPCVESRPPPVKEPLFSSSPSLGSGCRDHPELKQAVFVRSKPLCSPQPDYARRGKQTVAAAAAATAAASSSH